MMIPRELTEYKQLVLWRRAEVDGRKTKIPLSPWSGKAAACDKPQTWSTFHHVCHVRRRFRADGIGFVFTAADPFCGIDLDRCRTATGEITAQAADVIRKMNSYMELSPSRSGVHILLKAKMAANGRRSGLVEVYSAGRYFTMTGQHIAGTPVAIEDRQEDLDTLTAELFPPLSRVPRECPSSIGDLTDEEFIERAKCARAMGIASAACGLATPRSMETTTVEPMRRSVACSPFGLVATPNEWMDSFGGLV